MLSFARVRCLRRTVCLFGGRFACRVRSLQRKTGQSPVTANGSFFKYRTFFLGNCPFSRCALQLPTKISQITHPPSLSESDTLNVRKATLRRTFLAAFEVTEHCPQNKPRTLHLGSAPDGQASPLRVMFVLPVWQCASSASRSCQLGCPSSRLLGWVLQLAGLFSRSFRVPSPRRRGGSPLREAVDDAHRIPRPLRGWRQSSSLCRGAVPT